MPPDPLQQAERVVRGIHDSAGKLSRPVFRRYPLVFAFLIVFSVAAILHGFDLEMDKIGIFENHPIILIGIGVFILLCTGKLYKSLEKMR